MENLSGHSMDDVKVHYNSPMPSQLQAHAYAQGTDIHIAPGQEKHLPHEAWHVVQQKQGRVRPTLQMKSIAVNDDKGLEREADMMGGKAAQMHGAKIIFPVQSKSVKESTLQRVVAVNNVDRDFDGLWPEVLPLLNDETPEQQDEIRVILKDWVSSPAESMIPLRKSENRQYATLAELVAGLRGELSGKAVEDQEKVASAATLEHPGIQGLLDSAMARIIAVYPAIPRTTGRYAFTYSTFFTTTLHNAVANWRAGGPVVKTIALILDLSLALRDDAHVILAAAGNSTAILSPEHIAARGTHWNPNESAPWTTHARMHRQPLSAGPSATTGQMMKVARAAAVNAEEMQALAMAAYAFWNKKAFRHKSGIHTRYEVFDVLNFHLTLIP